MPKSTIESETRKTLLGIKSGKTSLKKANILIADLELQMTLLVKEIEAVKAARLKILNQPVPKNKR